jgi:hypothetical protein
MNAVFPGPTITCFTCYINLWPIYCPYLVCWNSSKYFPTFLICVLFIQFITLLWANSSFIHTLHSYNNHGQLPLSISLLSLFLPKFLNTWKVFHFLHFLYSFGVLFLTPYKFHISAKEKIMKYFFAHSKISFVSLYRYVVLQYLCLECWCYSLLILD